MRSNNTINSIQNYLRWIITQYQALQQQQSQQDAYRIVNHEALEKGERKLTIQVIGKSITFKATPEEIAADDQMLERFSRKDVRIITYYACQEIKKPKSKIIWQEFRDKLNRMVFGIKKRGEENIAEKTAAQISLDKDLINELSQEDAHMVGYITGSELHIEEKAQLEKLKAEEK